MNKQRGQRGFSLSEVLLVLAIIGIISGIAIPAFLGHRSRAKVIGVIRPTVKLMQMALDQSKIDNGTFPDGGTYTWSIMGTNVAYPGPNPVPSFVPSTSAGINLELKLTIPTGSLAYFIQVRDPVQGNHYFQVDQDGKETTF